MTAFSELETNDSVVVAIYVHVRFVNHKCEMNLYNGKAPI